MAVDVTVAPDTASTWMLPASSISCCMVVIARPPRLGVSKAPSMAASCTAPLPVSTVSSTVTSPPYPGAVADAVTGPEAPPLPAPSPPLQPTSENAPMPSAQRP